MISIYVCSSSFFGYDLAVFIFFYTRQSQCWDYSFWGVRLVDVPLLSTESLSLFQWNALITKETYIVDYFRIRQPFSCFVCRCPSVRPSIHTHKRDSFIFMLMLQLQTQLLGDSNCLINTRRSIIEYRVFVFGTSGGQNRTMASLPFQRFSRKKSNMQYICHRCTCVGFSVGMYFFDTRTHFITLFNHW